MLFDTHTHINDEKYPSSEQIVQSFAQDGVGGCIIAGCDKETSLSALDIARTNDNIYSTVGLHPHYANKFDLDMQNVINTLCQDDKVVAVGEIGLDYHYDFCSHEVQRDTFVKQIELAYLNKLPIVFHIREAMGDFETILQENADKLAYGGVVHSYSGSIESANKFLRYGLYLSFNGVITFNNANKIIDVVKAVPMDRILIETDCPYLTPVPYRGQLNYPKYVRIVAEKIGEIKSISTEEVIEQSYENAKKLFKRMK